MEWYKKGKVFIVIQPPPWGGREEHRHTTEVGQEREHKSSHPKIGKHYLNPEPTGRPETPPNVLTGICQEDIAHNIRLDREKGLYQREHYKSRIGKDLKKKELQEIATHYHFDIMQSMSQESSTPRGRTYSLLAAIAGEASS